MKKFLSLFLVLLICVTATAESTPSAEWEIIPIETAVEAVRKHMNHPKANYYSLERDPKEDWIIFVDPSPGMGWEHLCYTAEYPKFIKVGDDPTRFTVYPSERMTPPEGTLTPVYLEVSFMTNQDYRPYVKKATLTQAQLDDAEHTYAIIINGGVTPFMNYERYWNDCSFIYQTLTNRFGVPKKNIYPLMSDGEDPAADMFTLDGRYTSQSLDLDRDGADESIQAATKSNVKQSFNSLKQSLTAGDQVLIYVMDHGGYDTTTKESYICLWNNEQLNGYELNEMIARLLERGVSVNVLLGQCYAGGFLKYTGLSGCVTMAACGETEPSWACPDIPYDEFVYHWTCGINGADHKMTPIDHKDMFEDNHYTMLEAYEYAMNNDRQPEHPCYRSAPEIAGYYHSFDDKVDEIDLYIRDNDRDYGFMPNTTTDKNWKSPDIWVRNSADNKTEHENPYYAVGHENAMIYVRIHNRSSQKFTGKRWVHVHWSLAGTTFDAKDWQSRATDEEGHVIAEHLRPILIPNIEPYGDVVVKVGWTLPADLFELRDEIPQHYCLFAKITDSPADATSDDGTRYYDVLNSKLQAQKNVSIVEPSDIKTGVAVYVRNPDQIPRHFELEFIPKTQKDHTLYKKAKIDLLLGSKLLEGWQAGGMRKINVTQRQNGLNAGKPVMNFAAPESRLQSIKLAGETFDKVVVRFDFQEYDETDQEYTYDLIQRDEEGNIVGGETFVIKAPKLVKLPLDIVKIDHAGGKVELKVDDPTYKTMYWKNALGDDIQKGSSITVKPTGTDNEFLVHAFTPEGNVAVATIKLDPTVGIESVTKPASDKTKVTLRAGAEEGGRLVLTSVLNNAQSVTVPLETGAASADIDMAQLPKGVYAVTYMVGDEIVETVKFTY